MFLLRFQAQTQPGQDSLPSSEGKIGSAVSAGTKTFTEIKHEAADKDPASEKFEAIPKADSQ